MFLAACFLCFLDLSMEIVQLAEKFKDRGVVGIDLAGMEGAVPMDEHKPAFEVLSIFWS